MYAGVSGCEYVVVLSSTVRCANGRIHVQIHELEGLISTGKHPFQTVWVENCESKGLQDG